MTMYAINTATPLYYANHCNAQLTGATARLIGLQFYAGHSFMPTTVLRQPLYGTNVLRQPLYGTIVL